MTVGFVVGFTVGLLVGFMDGLLLRIEVGETEITEWICVGLSVEIFVPKRSTVVSVVCVSGLETTFFEELKQSWCSTMWKGMNLLHKKYNYSINFY